MKKGRNNRKNLEKKIDFKRKEKEAKRRRRGK